MQSKRTIIIAAVAATASILVLAALGFGYRALQGRIEQSEAKFAAAEKNLAAYKQFAAHLADARPALAAQKEKLAVTLQREQSLFRHVQRIPLVFRSDVDVILTLEITYTFGFDLAAGKFSIAASENGIEMTVGAPILLAPPAVRLASVAVSDRSQILDENKAAALLNQQLSGDWAAKGAALAQQEDVKQLCEKKLMDALRDYLAKQPDVKFVPVISVSHPS